MTVYNITRPSADLPSRAVLNRIHMLLLVVVAGGLAFVGSAYAQSSEEATARTGGVQGTVIDMSGDPVSEAAVVLQGPAGERLVPRRAWSSLSRSRASTYMPTIPASRARFEIATAATASPTRTTSRAAQIVAG